MTGIDRNGKDGPRPVSQSPTRLERRVVAAAEATLAREQSVSPLDVLAQIGWLPWALVDG